jgi:hypothetical protein
MKATEVVTTVNWYELHNAQLARNIAALPAKLQAARSAALKLSEETLGLASPATPNAL